MKSVNTLKTFGLAVLLTTSLTGFSASHGESAKKIFFVSGDNCPYACTSKGYQGIWIDVIRELLAPYDYDVEHQIRPIKRVHHEVRSVEADSKNYLFTIRSTRVGDPHKSLPGTTPSIRPILYYRGCFVTRQGDDWQYRGHTNTQPIKLGVMAGLDYGPLSQFLQRPDQAPLTAYTVGNNPALLNLKMLVSGRLDAMTSDNTMLRFLAAEEGLSDKIRFTNCDPLPQPFYLVFPSKHPDTDTLRQHIDAQIDTRRMQSAIDNIYAKYKITDIPR